MEVERVEGEFTVCKVEDWSQVDLDDPLCFAGRTDRERSLVCRTERVPDNTLEREDGWRAFRIAGKLDFSLIGVLSELTGILAGAGIGVFAVSTYDTDYILVRSGDLDRALDALASSGHNILRRPTKSQIRPA